MGQDVFISYSRVDLPFVERLDAFLTDVGVTTSALQTYRG